MRQHRYISILVVVILTVALTCLAGCGKKDTKQDSDSKATQTTSQEKKDGYKNKVIQHLSKTKWMVVR